LSTLDLSGASLGAFDTIPSNWYDASVFEVKEIEIEKEGGVLALGTKGYNVQFKIEGGEYDNRRVFNRFYLPTPDQHPDQQKRNTMLGRFGDFLKAAGYSEKDITSGKFKFDAEDIVGRELRISVGIDGDYNTVRNYKPKGGDLAEDGLI